VTGIGLAFTLLGASLLGYEITARAWTSGGERAPRLAERALYASLIGSCVWLASTWALALLHLLDRRVLIGRGVVMAIVALALLAKRLGGADLRRNITVPRGPVIGCIVVLLPLLVWIDFSLWRGFVTPPASIDALSHHLPKAVLFAREHGYDALREVRFILSWRPSNYELLLADAIVLEGSDRATEWISTYFYAAFVLSALGLAERWSGGGVATLLATALLVGGVPVALLHSTDYKNDVMAAYFSTAAIVALDRWLNQRDLRAAVLAIAALVAAAGTKQPSAILAALAIPLLAWPLLRREVSPTRLFLTRIGAFSVAALLLLGGVAYVTRLRDRAATVIESTDTASYTERTYGHWSNVWKAPYVLIAQSFSPDSTRVSVPWSRNPWLWQRFSVYYSELGIPFSVCALAFPACIVFFRRRAIGQLATSAAALLAFVAILPFDSSPIGRYLVGLPRFALTIVPVVFAWTALPFVAWLEKHRRWAAQTLIIAAAGFFVWYGFRNAVYDEFAPLDYVVWARSHPDTRLPPLGRGRAPAVLDEAAGPRDHVAFHGGVSSLLYLTYGASLQRHVTLIPPGRGAPAIDDRVKWVVVDRSGNLIWGNENLRDFSDAHLVGRGKPTEEDLRVLRALMGDSRFAVEYWRPGALQAVFRRKTE